MPNYQPLRCHEHFSVQPEIFQYKYFVRLYKKHNIICQIPTHEKYPLRLNLWHNMCATTPYKFVLDTDIKESYPLILHLIFYFVDRASRQSSC